jgi:hypothetical protein
VLLFAMGGYTAGGTVGLVVGGLVGAVWSGILMQVVRFIDRTKRFRSALATGSLIAAGALLVFTLGMGTLEYALMAVAFDDNPEWVVGLTHGVIAQQDILVFIIFNSLLEAVVVPVAVLLNWREPARRSLVIAGASIFYAVRIWTYIYFAPAFFGYNAIASTAELFEILRLRMTLDYGRALLEVAEAILFFWAAVRPASQTSSPSGNAGVAQAT